MVEPITVLYLDLEKLISNCKFSVRDVKIIDSLMLGYDFEDLAEGLHVDIRAIKNKCKFLYQKIADENEFLWHEHLEINGIIKIPASVKYKRCTKCDKDLRINENNFFVSKFCADGFENQCKMCKNKSK